MLPSPPLSLFAGSPTLPDTSACSQVLLAKHPHCLAWVLHLALLSLLIPCATQAFLHFHVVFLTGKCLPVHHQVSDIFSVLIHPIARYIAIDQLFYLLCSISFYSAPNWISAAHNLWVFRIRYIFVSHLKNKGIKLPDGIKYWFLDLVLLKIEPVKIMLDWKDGKKARGQSKYCASRFWGVSFFFFQAGLLQVTVTWK